MVHLADTEEAEGKDFAVVAEKRSWVKGFAVAVEKRSWVKEFAVAAETSSSFLS